MIFFNSNLDLENHINLTINGNDIVHHWIREAFDQSYRCEFYVSVVNCAST